MVFTLVCAVQELLAAIGDREREEREREKQRKEEEEKKLEEVASATGLPATHPLHYAPFQSRNLKCLTGKAWDQ